MFGSSWCVCVCVFLFFFFLHAFWDKFYCYSYCLWTVAAKFDLLNNFQPISAHRALFTDPQISLFSNFFIKNGSYGTIHIFKNYFATVFFSFQFSAVSKQTLSLFSCSTYCLNLQLWFFSHLQEINCVDQISSSLFTCWLFSTPTTIMTCCD